MKGSSVIVDALDVLEAELVAKATAASIAAPSPKLHPLVDRALEVPKYWVGHKPGGSIHHFEMGRTVSPVVSAGTLMQYRNVDGVTYSVRYALAPVTTVVDGSHFWLTEIAADRYDGEL